MERDLETKRTEIKSSISEIEIKLEILRDALDSLREAVNVIQSIKAVETTSLFKKLESNFPENGIVFQTAVKRYEVNLIKQALRVTRGNQTRAAKLLQLKPSTLNAIIKRNNIAY